MKINVKKIKSESREKHIINLNLHKRNNNQFPSNLKNDMKEKLDYYLERNVNKVNSNDNFDKNKYRFQCSNSKDGKTINIKKGMLINEQNKVNSIFMNGKSLLKNSA